MPETENGKRENPWGNLGVLSLWVERRVQALFATNNHERR
jgi:hypothetical protein